MTTKRTRPRFQPNVSGPEGRVAANMTFAEQAAAWGAALALRALRLPTAK